jgi:hypothetical protein
MNHVEKDVDEGKEKKRKEKMLPKQQMRQKIGEKKTRSMRSANLSPLMYCHESPLL